MTIGCIGIQTVSGLAGAEGDDASNRIVRGDSDSDAISGNDFDAEPTHSTAELGEHFVTGIALNAVETAAVYRDHGALHVNEIVLAQTARIPFLQTIIVP
jgi:hypothetical protein